MLSRLQYALQLKTLQFGEWIEDLSPWGRRLLILALILLLAVAAYFGLLPRKHLYPNRHAVFNW